MENKEKIDYLARGIGYWVFDALHGIPSELTESRIQYGEAIEYEDIDTAKKLESQLSDFQKITLTKLRGSGTKLAAQDLKRLLATDSSKINSKELKSIQETLATYDKLIK